jgi:hypothetical protein
MEMLQLQWVRKPLLTVLLTAAFGLVGRAADLPKGIASERYMGWDGALKIEAKEAEAKLIVVPEIGGRIMRYEVMGDNILWDNPAARGLTVTASRRALMPGGFQTSVGSDTAFLGSMERLEYSPYAVTTPRDLGVALASTPDLITQLKMEKEFVLDGNRGEVGIMQRLSNSGEKEIICSIRSRAMCKGGGFVIVPVNKKSRFRLGWTLRRVVEDKGIYDTLNPTLPQVKNLAGVLVIETGGAEQRIGLDTDAEWIGYVLDRTLFVQYFSHHAQARYPRGGHTVEIGWDELTTELQIFSPEGPLGPGKALEAPLKWALMPLKDAVSNTKQARGLVAKVPPSPFKSAAK